MQDYGPSLVEGGGGTGPLFHKKERKICMEMENRRPGVGGRWEKSVPEDGVLYREGYIGRDMGMGRAINRLRTYSGNKFYWKFSGLYTNVQRRAKIRADSRPDREITCQFFLNGKGYKGKSRGNKAESEFNITEFHRI